MTSQVDLPDTMRAAVYLEPGKLEIQERPLPDLGPDDVLVRVSHCGICGTDLHLVLEGLQRPGAIGGHEYSGFVAAVGGNVKDWNPGDRVVGQPFGFCGRCRYCTSGRPSLCLERPGLAGITAIQGAFAEYAKLPVSQLVRIPDGLPTRVAALAEPLAVALHAMTLARVEAGQRVLVSGAGAIGLLLVAALAAQGVSDISVSEPAQARRLRAGGLGARTLLEPHELGIPAVPFDTVDDPYDIVFECSGRPRAMEVGLAQLRRGGVLMLVGTGIQPLTFDYNRILLNELVVTGSFVWDEHGIEAALALLAAGKLRAEELIEPTDVRLDNLLDTLLKLDGQRLVGKVMVAPPIRVRPPLPMPCDR